MNNILKLMTKSEAMSQLQFDQDMALYDAVSGKKVDLDLLKLYNEDNYKTYIADEIAINALMQTHDQNCSLCVNKHHCAIHDMFNIDYCSDWKM